MALLVGAKTYVSNTLFLFSASSLSPSPLPWGDKKKTIKLSIIWAQAHPQKLILLA